jgi:hypothetical protein
VQPFGESESGLKQKVDYLDISFGLIGDLHDKFSLSVDHMLKNLLINAVGCRPQYGVVVGYLDTYTAPKLSELDTNRYSLPSAINWSSTPEWSNALYKSP